MKLGSAKLLDQHRVLKVSVGPKYHLVDFEDSSVISEPKRFTREQEKDWVSRPSWRKRLVPRWPSVTGVCCADFFHTMGDQEDRQLMNNMLWVRWIRWTSRRFDGARACSRRAARRRNSGETNFDGHVKVLVRKRTQKWTYLLEILCSVGAIEKRERSSVRLGAS